MCLLCMCYPSSRYNTTVKIYIKAWSPFRITRVPYHMVPTILSIWFEDILFREYSNNTFYSGTLPPWPNFQSRQTHNYNKILISDTVQSKSLAHWSVSQILRCARLSVMVTHDWFINHHPNKTLLRHMASQYDKDATNSTTFSLLRRRKPHLLVQ